VRRSYREPIETLSTNVMGTAILLEAARAVPSIRAIVVVTSDKCYENDGSVVGYHEDHPMGGHDLYSASKGCAELVTAAYRRSFLADCGIAVASARAGNVIGGGDWSEDRLIPDLLMAAADGKVKALRNPSATRPWQFVLEPLRGYLMLARALVEVGPAFAGGWNFGPAPEDAVPVREVARRLRREWDLVRVRETSTQPDLHEAETLVLDCEKARDRLGWSPVLTLDDALSLTVAWYRACHGDRAAVPALVERQLHEYAGRVLKVCGHDAGRSPQVPRPMRNTPGALREFATRDTRGHDGND
jgi:CDP-glucose 4,6-dehydratase